MYAEHYIMSSKFRFSLAEKSRWRRLKGFVPVAHCGIENNVHWCLDINFREGECRIRQGHAAENFSRLNRLALDLLKAEKTNTTCPSVVDGRGCVSPAHTRNAEDPLIHLGTENGGGSTLGWTATQGSFRWRAAGHRSQA
jgi:hypothetical protein